METIEALKTLDRNHNCEVYFVGGYVRDAIRRKKNADLDIVVRNIDVLQLRKFLNKHGKTKFLTLAFSSTPTILFKAYRDETEVQITFPRNAQGKFEPFNDIREDCTHRDFTINAMYLPINYKSKNDDVLDFSDGLHDIKKRLIRSVGDPAERIKESPIRILRAISLASKTGYRIHSCLIESIKENVNLLKRVPMENIRKELDKILLSAKPSKYFKIMQKLGVLKIILPELNRCVGVKQDKRYHKFDVFKHCVYTCDNIDPVIVLRLAAVLHDIGKPDTRKENRGRTTFHRHDVIGAQLTKRALKRLKYEKEIIKEVVHLVKYHMYHYTRDFTDPAIVRFIKKTRLTEEDMDDLGNFPLFKLRCAERKGNGFKTVPITDRQLDFEKRIRKVFIEKVSPNAKGLDIDGHIVMKLFNMEESKRVGDVLEYLTEKTDGNPKLNNRVDLVKLAAEFIYYKM